MPELTEKQRKFVEAYMGAAAGNATEAARLAGYKGNNETLAQVGAENIRKPYIAQELRARANKDPLIATREDRQRFWTEVMESGGVEMKDRLRASEILGKSQADFVDRIESVNYNIDLSGLSDEEIQELEEADDPAAYLAAYLASKARDRKGEEEA